MNQEYHYEIGTARWKIFTRVGDFRQYNPPAGWEVQQIRQLDAHPVTGAPFVNGSQWWVKEKFVGETAAAV